MAGDDFNLALNILADACSEARLFLNAIGMRQHLLHFRHHICHRRRQFFDLSGALMSLSAHGVDGRQRLFAVALELSDDFLDIPGCFRSARGEVAHFIGYDGKPATLFASTRCLNRRVECQ